MSFIPMHWYDGIAMDVFIVFLTSLSWAAYHANGLDVRINGKHDCDQTYDLMEHEEVHIRVIGRVFTGDLYRCQVTVNNKGSNALPQICVTPVTVDISACNVEIDIHNEYHIADRFWDKQYTCRPSSYDEDCTYLDGQVVIFRRVLNNTSIYVDDSVDIHLKVYSKKTDWSKTNKAGEPIEGLETRYILMIIGGAATILSCCCGTLFKSLKCNAAGQECCGTLFECLKCNAAGQEAEAAAGYPSVQYRTATQADAPGYQPSEGFQKTGFDDATNLAAPPPSYNEALTMKSTAPT